MLDLRHVTANLDQVRLSLARRSSEAAGGLDRVAAADARRRDLILQVERLQAERNQANVEMARLDKKGEAFAQKREALKSIAQQTKALEQARREVEQALEELLLGIPNLPDASTPDGRSSEDNPVVRVWGQAPEIADPKDHVDLGLGLEIFDFDRAAKISGARFAVLRGQGARLERALMAFMLDLHTEIHGYLEIWPPVLIKDSAMRGTGQLPKFASDAFRIDPGWRDAIAQDGPEAAAKEAGDLYLAPTAEVPLTNLHAGEILDSDALPTAYTAYTPCFRSEAGSYGKDTRGLIRQHQFDKVELVRFERPEAAEQALETLTSHAEEVLRRLRLHHRVVALCAGDLGFASQKTYDLEVWLPAQSTFREISSCSWFGDYQARRANIRYRSGPGEKPRFLHTLNGSGLAIGRTLVAILEQYQNPDGSVRLPEALVPYMGGLRELRAI